MTGHSFHSSLLREYDIRGIVGETLHEADAEAIGRAFGTLVRRDGGACVALAYDGRLSSPAMAEAVAGGLRACGLKVLRCGLGPTPLLYFAAQRPEVHAGIMVTGSHNPPDFNGFKFVFAGKPFFGDRIQELGKIAETGAFETGEGSEETVAPLEDYVARLVQDYDGIRPLSVAWDAGNGAAGEAMAALTRRLPGRHFLLYEEIDGRFPNHHPDPTKEDNLADLKELVAKQGCDLGIAFDGDGDRIGVIDDSGRVLWGDQLLILFARDILRDHPGAPIIADVKSSQVLFDEVAKAGGRPIMHRTGHAPIKAKMAEMSAPLAGELSAHIFFADRYYGYDDALYAAVRLLGILARSDESLSSIRAALPAVVNTPEHRLHCPEDRKFAVVEEVGARLRAAGAEVNDIDGVRVSSKDGWWLLRASNTEPALVLRCEASDQAALDRLKAEVTAQLEQSGLDVPGL
ncbi:MAG: phosphomannomutase/phosphoglucomutase [Kiloniellales bacterium]|nr:phosphomannomutase/phosphoglucomutase [Kiloniellales bacterium]